jgi:anaerobic ribonucleoside-triphosphate reductase
MTINEVQKKIQELKLQKDSVEGAKCEVYSRVVGYLRPIASWNEGKREEFKTRKKYCFCK